MMIEKTVEVRRGNCFRLFQGKELIAVLPTEQACEVFVEAFSVAMPELTTSAPWRMELAFVAGIGF